MDRGKHWKQLKNERLATDNYCCAYCGEDENVICHHKTYENSPNEKLDDVISLCKRCHLLEHQFLEFKIPLWRMKEIYKIEEFNNKLKKWIKPFEEVLRENQRLKEKLIELRVLEKENRRLYDEIVVREFKHSHI